MRGSLTHVVASHIVAGIIPAHAGLTLGFLKGNRTLRDHPRACGAHSSSRSSAFDFRDHPRACGAHLFHQVRPPSVTGSSPRMRGSRTSFAVKSSARGIIPAHAGLTHQRHGEEIWFWDHPRACGAHRASSTSTRSSGGSSPRMRGSLCAVEFSDRVAGIIPAHAGLTNLLKKCGWSGRDHPRACGAHSQRPSRKGRK